jgi:hypothetical protein
MLQINRNMTIDIVPQTISQTAEKISVSLYYDTETTAKANWSLIDINGNVLKSGTETYPANLPDVLLTDLFTQLGIERL